MMKFTSYFFFAIGLTHFLSVPTQQICILHKKTTTKFESKLKIQINFYSEVAVIIFLF